MKFALFGLLGVLLLAGSSLGVPVPAPAPLPLPLPAPDPSSFNFGMFNPGPNPGPISITGPRNPVPLSVRLQRGSDINKQPLSTLYRVFTIPAQYIHGAIADNQCTYDKEPTLLLSDDHVEGGPCCFIGHTSDSTSRRHSSSRRGADPVRPRGPVHSGILCPRRTGAWRTLRRRAILKNGHINDGLVIYFFTYNSH